MICKNCGQQVQEGSRFCENCGSVVESEQNQNVQQGMPTYGQPASATFATPEKKSGNKGTIFAVVALVAIVVLVVLLLKSCTGGGYKSQLDDMVKVVNKQEADMDKIVETVLPSVLSNSYKDIMGILEGSDEYGDDIKDIKEDVNAILEDGFEQAFDMLEDEYGKNVKFSYEVLDKKKLEKKEREAISAAYKELADIAPGVIAIIEGLEECSEFEDKEIKKLVGVVEDLEKSLSKYKVSAGYILEVELTVKGKEDDDTSDEVEIVVVKANGDWQIDYLATIINLTGLKDIDELDEFVEDLEISEISDEMEEMAEYMEEYDEDAIGQIIEGLMDGLEEVEDFDLEDLMALGVAGSMSGMGSFDSMGGAASSIGSFY